MNMVDEEPRTRSPHELQEDPLIKEIADLDLFPDKNKTQAGIAWLKYSFIEKVADNVIDKFKHLFSEPILDLEKLCEELKSRVSIDDFFNFEEDITISKTDSTFVIKLPLSMDKNPRARFTIAHELGHYFIHYVLPILGGDSPFSYRFFRKDPSRFEKQADTFAASLTMPRRLFEAKAREVENKENRYEELASYFDVSRAAAEVRSKILRVFD